MTQDISPTEEAIRQQWQNEDVAFENAQIERAMENALPDIETPLELKNAMEGLIQNAKDHGLVDSLILQVVLETIRSECRV